MHLLDLIINKGESITETSKKLHVKLPTAKAILSSYRKRNHVFQRKKETFGTKEPHTNEEKNDDVRIVSNIPSGSSNKLEEAVMPANQEMTPLMSFEPIQLPIWYIPLNWWNFYCPIQTFSELTN